MHKFFELSGQKKNLIAQKLIFPEAAITVSIFHPANKQTSILPSGRGQ